MNLPKVPWYVWAGGAGAALAFLGVSSAHASPETALPGGKYSGPTPTIKLGATGDAVRGWQSLVGAPQTGLFDAATDAATKAFQSAHGLTSDGIVGPKTWGAMLGIPALSPGPNVQPPKVSTPAAQPTAPAPGPVSLSGGGSFGATMPTSIAGGDAAIIAAVRDGFGNIQWSTVTSERNGHTGIFTVMRRALSIGPDSDRFIVSMSFNGAQGVAQQIGARMLTSKLADLIWQQASLRVGVLNHSNWVQDGTMGNQARMREQSALLQAKTGNAGGLIANEGKHWVVTARNWTPPQGTGVEKPQGSLSSRHNGANYGWYADNATSVGPGGLKVFQSVGLAHDRNHRDYSQLVVLAMNPCIVDGFPTTLDAVIRDPVLSALISDEGPLPAMTHPDYLGGNV